MPELYSRMDSARWLTPSVSELLEKGSPPPGGDGSIRQQMQTLIEDFRALNTPVRIVNIQSTPTYTRYTARLDTNANTGRLTLVDVHRSLRQIAQKRRPWRIGLQPPTPESNGTFGILLQTDAHAPMNLRRFLTRSAYLRTASTGALFYGLTLAQEPVIRDLFATNHLLIIGRDKITFHVVRNILLTLILMNTPAELRVALASTEAQHHATFARTPHMLGSIIQTANDLERLLQGLTKEIQRRSRMLDENKANTLFAYNEIQEQSGQPILPRILLLIDDVDDEIWQLSRSQTHLSNLISAGAAVGIHLVITAAHDSENLQPLREGVGTIFTTRRESGDISKQVDHFHPSLLRFVNGFVTDAQSEHPIPVECCIVSDSEIENTVQYWLMRAEKRISESQGDLPTITSGVTGYLSSDGPGLPVPDRPSAETLSRAAKSLAETNKQISSVTMQRAEALATYLGWLGIGPLHDVMGLSVNESKAVITALQEQEVLESGNSPTPRLARRDDME